MKRLATIVVMTISVLLGSVALAAPSQAFTPYGPKAKQLAKMLGCKKFVASKPKKSDWILARTQGTCVKSKVTYNVFDYGSPYKLALVHALLDGFLHAFDVKAVVGEGRTWLVDTKDGYGLPIPMRKAVKRAGGKVVKVGKK